VQVLVLFVVRIARRDKADALARIDVASMSRRCCG